MINILILSAGTRNKVVRYFKNELAGKGLVTATDCSELAPAIYEADVYEIVPRITDPGYLNCILDICRKRQITGVFSLIDPELTLLAENRDAFLAVGTKPVISDPDTVETCFDKFKMYHRLLELKMPAVRCYMDYDEFVADLDKDLVHFPVFVKPARGSASIQINKVSSKEEVGLLLSRFDGMMIQEFMDGTEYGADVYIDMVSGEVISIFVKEKIKMRAGETDKSVSVKDEGLFQLIERFVKSMNFRGIIDIDLFRIDGQYYISEVNPRFGGGYPHAYECGVNVPAQIIRNLQGETNDPAIGQYKEHVYMMKYNEIKIIEGEVIS